MSLATALAIVGVGVALARGERERRAAARKRRARSSSLLDGEPPVAALRRVIVGQLDIAIELLQDYPGESSEHTVHETRKALKRARAILRLLRDQLGDKRLAHENAALRDCARRLAGARDAVVALDTLDGLLKRHPKLTDSHRRRGAKAVRDLRARLLAEREGAIVDGGRGGYALGDTASTPERVEIERHGAVALELLAIRGRIAAWEPKDPRRASSSKLPAGGVERLYRQGRRRMRRARRRRGDATAMHTWRKSAKDLRYVAETLNRTGASAQDKSSKRLKRVARRADRLGEILGDEHDLAMLDQAVRSHAKRLPARKRDYKPLLKAIERRRKRLRKQALRNGERLYGRKPRRFVRRVRGAL
ncbi:MAG TPA: CHAD domain-containing protein [Solirubrobacteraceae bacterium]